jgi:hypothetical protein
MMLAHTASISHPGTYQPPRGIKTIPVHYPSRLAKATRRSRRMVNWTCSNHHARQHLADASHAVSAGARHVHRTPEAGLKVFDAVVAFFSPLLPSSPCRRAACCADPVSKWLKHVVRTSQDSACRASGIFPNIHPCFNSMPCPTNPGASPDSGLDRP